MHPAQSGRASRQISPVEIPGEEYIGGTDGAFEGIAIMTDGDFEPSLEARMPCQCIGDALWGGLEDVVELAAILDVQVYPSPCRIGGAARSSQKLSSLVGFSRHLSSFLFGRYGVFRKWDDVDVYVIQTLIFGNDL
jgi:hypothetical protein